MGRSARQQYEVEEVAVDKIKTVCKGVCLERLVAFK